MSHDSGREGCVDFDLLRDNLQRASDWSASPAFGEHSQKSIVQKGRSTSSKAIEQEAYVQSACIIYVAICFVYSQENREHLTRSRAEEHKS